jgi:hypothetical protein
MHMTPEQKIKWAILNLAAVFNHTPQLEVTDKNIDELYQKLVDVDGHWDAKEEIRNSGEETKIPCTEYSRHYDCDEVAAIMPDGTWVGWAHWHGGGKHSEPSVINWMDKAYNVAVKEEEKVVIVREFSKA